ncbi:hypothetical protein [Pseudonocardia asaccharolytica]|uniref:Lipoprotein n=1 Tax=Pseudonocardia asaccharolytica DSM 44247 = NBRC 16224 TaxID=1123024 RepID=A0A511D0T4_9PSEU|nr:hypothetical protein [Pseudonocardia asaccharolytica]GEL18401.1 hypothetical protein PA7_22380 [Pseudonocardia asaccharolytica DSM 44247 = NBRC 16224]
MTVRAGRQRFAMACVAIVAVLLALVGCGAPSFTYVANSAEHTYIKVPASWRPIDQRQLAEILGIDPAAGDQGFWMEAYDADSQPSPSHLFGPDAAHPVVFVSVQTIPEDVRGQLGLDHIRDLVYPVSPTARQQLEFSGSSTLSDFTLITDEVLTPGHGVRGVHSEYQYRIQEGPLQVIDQIGYLNDDASKLYLAFARCSAQCFQQREQEIESVISSFTVREQP